MNPGKLRRWTLHLTLVVLLGIFGMACEGPKGPEGPPGDPGDSCSVVDNGDGTKTLTCEDGTNVTIADGTQGTVCTLTDNGDGTKTLDCDGTVVTISDGVQCTVVDNGDGTKTLTCDDGTQVTIQDGYVPDPAAEVEPESCAVCHSHAGDEHQAIYDDYKDATTLELEIVSVVSTPDPSCIGTKACKVNSDCADNTCDGLGFCDGETDNNRCNDKTCDAGGVCSGEFSSVATFTIKKNGVPYVDLNMDPEEDDLPGLNQKRFIIATYDSAAGEFDVGGKYLDHFRATGNPGEYTAVTGTEPGTRGPLTFAPENSDAFVYGYIAAGVLDTESMTLYDDVASAAKAFGALTPGTYVSPANVSGCEKCHGKPYMKHGYRDPVVAGLDDFVSCKTCHYDTRNGGHEDWQILVDDPARYAEIAAGDDLTPEEEAKYAYKANVMNDVHMSHAMEFPYPQSMANCVTCHAGKLNTILTDANYRKEVCLSCHPRTGSDTYGTSERALETIWEKANVAALHDIDSTASCSTNCHEANGAATTRFADLHNGGYNKAIYTSAGLRYSDVFVVTVDSATFNSTTNALTVQFSATEVGGAGTIASLDADDIVPTILIGLYGYDSKDYIVGPHERDADRNRLLEFPIDGTTTNPRFTVVAAAGGSWEIIADLTDWAGMIADGTVKRAEIGVMPAQTMIVDEEDEDVGTCDPECERGYYCAADNTCEEEDDYMLALNAPSRTFDLTANSFDDDYFTDIVDVAGCNQCHDALATTFHSANRGGNIRVCRLCHITKSGGSHLEMQSRSIDSYAHAIHSFQVFDPGDIDFTDPVEHLRYEHHVEAMFPNFTIKNCKTCHNAGAFNVPNQAKSMPGKLSGSDTWNVDRNMPDVPSFVTGPAARACGGCHRAHKINEDDANGLMAFNQHSKLNGYLVEDGTGVLDTIIATIMAMFQ